jgi:hypothetical protein
MKVTEIMVGLRYRISGDLQNGNYVTHDDVVRKITRITDTHVICECGRRFIINSNLNIEKF